MVSIPLYMAVMHEIPKSYWPADFTAMVAELEKKPNDQTLMLALSDYCGEDPVLQAGFKYMAKHKIEKFDGCWRISDKISPEIYAHLRSIVPRDTVAGLAVYLGKAVIAVKADLEAKLKEIA